MLLAVGLIGELIYSVAGLVGLTGDSQWQTLSFLLLFVHITRLLQVRDFQKKLKILIKVGLQTFLLYVATRVKVRTADMDTQPGKQAITFLLAANLAIFMMNLFESEKPGVSEIIIGKTYSFSVEIKQLNNKENRLYSLKKEKMDFVSYVVIVIIFLVLNVV